MIAYKGTNNFKCQNMTYEVGKEYKCDGEIELCTKGYHFCKNIIDINTYYPINSKNTKILQIKVLGKTIDEKDKSVTNHLKIIKALTSEEIEKASNGKIKYDSNGNVTYFEYSNGLWYKQKFNSYGNRKYFEDSYGYWRKHEYDSNNNLIYVQTSTGYWFKHKYDSNGNRIYVDQGKK